MDFQVRRRHRPRSRRTWKSIVQGLESIEGAVPLGGPFILLGCVKRRVDGILPAQHLDVAEVCPAALVAPKRLVTEGTSRVHQGWVLMNGRNIGL